MKKFTVMIIGLAVVLGLGAGTYSYLVKQGGYSRTADEAIQKFLPYSEQYDLDLVHQIEPKQGKGR